MLLVTLFQIPLKLLAEASAAASIAGIFAASEIAWVACVTVTKPWATLLLASSTETPMDIARASKT